MQNNTPKKTISQKLSSWSARIRAGSLFAPRETIDAKDLKSFNIIRSANRCPFDVFERCLLSDDYSGLGDAPLEILQEAFLSIYYEYISLMDDGGTTDRIHHIGKIHALSNKIQVTKMIVSSIYDNQFEILFPVLHDLGYKFVRSAGDLPRVIALMKREEMNLKILIKNLPKQKEAKMDKNVFDDVFFRLSEHLHTVIHKDKITVSEYCTLLNGYKKHVEIRQQQAKSLNHGRR